MPRPPKARKAAAAARARAGKEQKRATLNNEDAWELSSGNMQLEEASDAECTGWTGGVNHVLSDSDDDEVPRWPRGKRTSNTGQKISSKHYTSHRKVPENVMAAFDA